MPLHIVSVQKGYTHLITLDCIGSHWTEVLTRVPSISIMFPLASILSTTFSLSNTINPKPLERLVAWSHIISCSTTFPYFEKKFLNSSKGLKIKKENQQVNNICQLKASTLNVTEKCLCIYNKYQTFSNWCWNPTNKYFLRLEIIRLRGSFRNSSFNLNLCQ